MDRSNLVPTPGLHRRLSRGIQPAIRPPQRMAEATQNLMGVTCPKCNVLFLHQRRVGLAMCKASEEPYFGDHRGCGWLLAVYPPHSAKGTRGTADAIMNARHFFRYEIRDFAIPRDVYKRVLLALFERWEARGLGKLEVREDGSFAWHHAGGEDDEFTQLTDAMNQKPGIRPA
jgi:hypothetical protein